MTANDGNAVAVKYGWLPPPPPRRFGRRSRTIRRQRRSRTTRPSRRPICTRTEQKWQVETVHRPQRTRHRWAVDCCRCACLLYEVAVTAALVRLAFHFPESCAIGGVIDPLNPFPPAWDTTTGKVASSYASACSA